jgi:hypothetical protein
MSDIMKGSLYNIKCLLESGHLLPFIYRLFGRNRREGGGTWQ